MKNLSNTKAELKESIAYKKSVYKKKSKSQRKNRNWEINQKE